MPATVSATRGRKSCLMRWSGFGKVIPSRRSPDTDQFSHHMSHSKILLSLLVLPLLGIEAARADWRQFLGPDQNHSDAQGLPLTWNETEHVKWRTALPGEGWSSPVV